MSVRERGRKQEHDKEGGWGGGPSIGNFLPMLEKRTVTPDNVTRSRRENEQQGCC